MSSQQPLLEQLCSTDILQGAADWLHSQCPQYRPDLTELGNKLKSGEYCFQPLTTVETTNKLGEPETLEVWQELDRLVLKAMSLVLKNQLSNDFPTCCHHLEGRGGIKKAVRKTRKFVQTHPDSWVLKTDVKGYYALMDHVVLYNQLQSLMPNEQYLLRLCWQYLKRTVYDGGNYYDIERGISLGSPLSPLMAALYLQPLDEAFEGPSWFYARFMDDWVVIVPTRWKLNSALESVNVILNQHKLHEAAGKTFIGRSKAGFAFLGYHFTPESLTMGKVSLQRRDARIHRLYEQGADNIRVGEYVSRWQRWARAGLSGRLTSTEEFHNFPRQVDSSKLPLEAKFLALGVASVLSTAAIDSHATIYQHGDTIPMEPFASECFALGATYTQAGRYKLHVNTEFSYCISPSSANNESTCDSGWEPTLYNAMGGHKGSNNDSVLSAKCMTDRVNVAVNGNTHTSFIAAEADAQSLWNPQFPVLLTIGANNGTFAWVRIDYSVDSLLEFLDPEHVVRYGIGDALPTIANTANLATTTSCPDFGNNTPNGGNHSMNLSEDGTGTHSGAFKFCDQDGDTLFSITITSLPAASSGSLKYNGSLVVVPQTILEGNLSHLSFHPVLNGFGNNFGSFKFTVNDGTDDSASEYTYFINVSAINDPPTITGVNISGTVKSGQTLTASLTGYNDVESNPQGTHLYQWHTGTDSSCTGKADISGATSSTYTITNNEIDKYLCVTVTPKDDIGDAGTPVTATTSTSVPKLDQTITGFTPPTSKTFGDATFALSATGGSSGNSVTFDSTTTAVCTVSANNVTIKSGGTCTVTASQAGNANYDAAPQLSENITINKADQTITGFTPPTLKTYGDADFALSATGGSSGNSVTFDSTTTAVCTVSANNVTIKSGGTCTVTASQAGNANYDAAPQLSENITINKADITAQAENKTRAYGEANPTFTVTYTGLVNGDTAPSTPPTLATTANTTTPVGTATISCTATTDTNYNTTTCTDGTLTITKADTTTTINSDNADPSVIGASITVDVSVASSTSGTPTGTVTIDDANSHTCDVTLSSGTGNCSLTPADGNSTLTASYSGDSNFNSSADTEPHASLATGISVDEGDGVSLAESGTTDTYTLTAFTVPASAITVTITADDQTQVKSDGSFANTATVSITDLTTHTITVKAIDDSDVEGNHTAQVTHAITTGDSGDYSTNLSIASISASISDNEPGVIITQTNSNTQVSEGGATDSFDIVLNTQPANDVTITVTPDSQTTVDNETLTFTNSNWNTAQTVLVTAVNDSTVENSHSSTISLSATSDDSNYNNASFVVEGTVAASLSVNITDNDTPPPAPAPTPARTSPSTNSSSSTVITIPSGGGPIVEFEGEGSGFVRASERSSGEFSCHSSETCPTQIQIGWYRFEATADQGSEFVEWRGQNCEKGEFTTSFGGTCIAVFKKLPKPPQEPIDITKSPETPTVPKVTEPIPVVTVPTPTVPTLPVVTEPVKPVEVNKVGFSAQAYQASENAGKVDITVNRQGTTGEVSVDLLNSDDSGKASIHYHPIAQTLFWAKGDDTDITVPVEIIDNFEVDGNKAVILSLGNVDNAEIHLDTAVLTIEDDDKPQVAEAKPEPNVPSVPVITEEPTQVESAPIEDVAVVEPDEFALPTNTVVGSGPVNQCNTSDELIGVCHAHAQNIRYQTIGEEDSLSNGILDHPLTSQGIVSNTTITEKGLLKGGKVSGSTQNEGLIEDVEFVGILITGKNEDGEIKGMLGGEIKLASQVGGVVEDVRLAPATSITGSEKRSLGFVQNRDQVGGTLIGDAEKPAILNRLHIRDNSQVSNVILTENVTFGEDVTFTNVEFRTQVVRKVTVTGQISGTRFKETTTKIESVTISANSHLSNLVIGDNVKFEEGVTLEDSVTFEVHTTYMETHSIDTLPKLKGLSALDKQGKPLSTWARLEGGARMGTEGSGKKRYSKKLTFKRNPHKDVDIHGNVLTDVRHIGKRADILVVAAHTPPGETSPNFYMLDSNGTPLPWDGAISSLVPFQSRTALAPVVSVPIWNKPLDIVGEVQVYFGYRLNDGLIVYSQEEMIELTLTE